MSQSVASLTMKARFQNAIKEARANGVKVRQNVQSCCRGCVTEEKLGMKREDQPYAFTFGGQGMAYSWIDEDEAPVNREDMKRSQRSYYRTRQPKIVESVMFNWGNDSAEALVEAFKNNGFDVEWDGSEYSCVEVKFK